MPALNAVCLKTFRPRYATRQRAGEQLKPLPDQEPSPLILVQVKLFDGHSLSSLAIRRFDRAYMFAFAAHDDHAPASELGGLEEYAGTRRQE